jgi:hypothetical protein
MREITKPSWEQRLPLPLPLLPFARLRGPPRATRRLAGTMKWTHWVRDEALRANAEVNPILAAAGRDARSITAPPWSPPAVVPDKTCPRRRRRRRRQRCDRARCPRAQAWTESSNLPQRQGRASVVGRSTPDDTIGAASKRCAVCLDQRQHTILVPSKSLFCCCAGERPEGARTGAQARASSRVPREPVAEKAPPACSLERWAGRSDRWRYTQQVRHAAPACRRATTTTATTVPRLCPGGRVGRLVD